MRGGGFMKSSYRFFGVAVLLLLAIVASFIILGREHTTEAVTIRGFGLSETGEEYKVEREEEVALLVGAFEDAARTEGPVKAIGPNLTFTFHLENGYAVEYPVWKGTDSGSFEDPTQKTTTEQGDVRYVFAQEDWERVLELLEER
jgi:hypothetical protein